MIYQISRTFRVPAVILLLLANVFASEINLKNGDRISGEIVEETESAIVVETPYAGKLTIARKHIREITGGTPASTDVAATRSEAAPPVKVKTPVAPPAAAAFKRPAHVFGNRFLDGWEGNVNVGFSFTSGNSNYSTMSTGLRVQKAGTQDNLSVYVRSLWNKNRNSGGHHVTTQNAFWGGARYDRNLTEKTFGFISYDFERDRPKNLNFRSVAGGGLGRHVVKTENTQLDVLIGNAWNRTWQIGSNTDTPEGIAGVTFKQRIHEKLRLQSSVNYFQNITDKAEFRSIVDATLTVDVTKRIGIFITVGDRFNNDPGGTSRKNDVLVNTGLKWNFGKKG